MLWIYIEVCICMNMQNKEVYFDLQMQLRVSALDLQKTHIYLYKTPSCITLLNCLAFQINKAKL